MVASCASIQKSFPHLSIVVAILIILVQLIIICLLVVSPATLDVFEGIYSHRGFDLNETIYLSEVQRTSLGITTIIILLEGILFGILSVFREVKMSIIQAMIIKPAKSSPPSDDHPLVQHTLGVDQLIFVPSSIKVRTYFKLDPSQKALVRKQIAHYIAEIGFEVVKFLTKWILALLVIRGNWISVGVTIAAGIGYPILQFWSSVLKVQRFKLITKPIHPPSEANLN